MSSDNDDTMRMWFIMWKRWGTLLKIIFTRNVFKLSLKPKKRKESIIRVSILHHHRTNRKKTKYRKIFPTTGIVNVKFAEFVVFFSVFIVIVAVHKIPQISGALIRTVFNNMTHELLLRWKVYDPRFFISPVCRETHT